MLFVCIIASEIGWKYPEISNLLTGNGENIFEKHEYWRAFTTTFVHGDLAHLLSNCYMLGIIGYFVFGYFGFSMYPIGAIIASTVINLISIKTYSKEVTLLGASGMVYYLYGFWLTMFVFLERRYSVGSRLIRVIGFGLIVLFPSTFEKEVSYRTHVIGFVLGVPVAVVYFFLHKQELQRAEEWVEVVED